MNAWTRDKKPEIRIGYMSKVTLNILNIKEIRKMEGLRIYEKPDYPHGLSGFEKYKVWGKWALTDSNRRPSACKADALNQLS